MWPTGDLKDIWKWAEFRIQELTEEASKEKEIPRMEFNEGKAVYVQTTQADKIQDKKGLIMINEDTACPFQDFHIPLHDINKPLDLFK